MLTPFERTTCACDECVGCCKRQPGALAPGQFEEIAAALGEPPTVALAHFWASPGALVRHSASGQEFRIGTITPRMHNGRCVFLDDADRCRIHAVAPFGCAFFDVHQSRAESMPRSTWLVRQTMDPQYQALRRWFPPATSYQPTSY